jgi:RimJ/RimL family protein N-acetyltransferase
VERLAPRLETERLELVPVTLELVAALDAPATAHLAVGAAIPADWPDEELRGLLSLYGGWLRDDPSVLGFGPWLAVARRENVVVGSAGFVGKPDERGSIELGYGIHAVFRNRGYATEASAALVGWGLVQHGVERVIASCDPDNAPSVRVLEKLRMARVGTDSDGQLLWERRRD